MTCQIGSPRLDRLAVRELSLVDTDVARGVEKAIVPLIAGILGPDLLHESRRLSSNVVSVGPPNFSQPVSLRQDTLMPMKITKLEHACLDITDGSSRLIVDPGGWTSPLSDYSNIAVLVITHVHADHFDPEKVQAVLAANNGVRIFTTHEVAAQLPGTEVTVPELGEEYTAGKFTLEFFGGKHASIMEGYPPAGANHNFGVLINGTLYYPGDSLTPCPKPHKVLALPAVAPWLKLSEAVDFMAQDSASEVFPTHNNIVNENGEGLLNRLLGGSAEQQGKTYHALKPGESIDF